jgi:hypothetical protein
VESQNALTELIFADVEKAKINPFVMNHILNVLTEWLIRGFNKI